MCRQLLVVGAAVVPAALTIPVIGFGLMLGILLAILHKVKPSYLWLTEWLAALSGYEAWITGLRRVDTDHRAGAAIVEWDEKHSMIKINPLVAWTMERVHDYAAEHGCLLNPLLDDGYPSIGCEPCTLRVEAGADPRSGRWAGSSKTECGIHL